MGNWGAYPQHPPLRALHLILAAREAVFVSVPIHGHNRTLNRLADRMAVRPVNSGGVRSLERYARGDLP